MIHEAKNAFDTYFPENVKASYKGDLTPVNNLLEVLCSGEIIFDDKPDIVAVLGKKALLIEHFEFDSYKRQRNGSRSRIERSRIDRITQSIVPTEEGVIYHEQIRGDSSIADYEKNVIVGFNKHYEKIDKYRRRVQDFGIVAKDSDTQVVFLIEDKTPIGAIAYDGSDFQAINLAEDEKFLSFLEGKPDVEYVIACSTVVDKQSVWIIARSQLQHYLKDTVNYQQMKFLNSTPHIIGASILLPEIDK
jgi:hypothetical protein